MPLHRFRGSARFDPYRSDSKPQGRVICRQCGAVSSRGRWVSSDRPLGRIKEQLCPACRQEDDRYAHGVVELRGERWKKKIDLIERTVWNTERIARLRNDQERVLWSGTTRGVTKIYVTLPGLARRIGRALERAFRGKTDYVRSKEEPYLRVRWWSDEPPERPEAHRSRAFRGRGKALRSQR